MYRGYLCVEVIAMRIHLKNNAIEHLKILTFCLYF